MKYKKEIELLLENCEVITTNSKDLAVFDSDNIRNNISLEGEYRVAESVNIVINHKTNKKLPLETLSQDSSIHKVYVNYIDGFIKIRWLNFNVCKVYFG